MSFRLSLVAGSANHLPEQPCSFALATTLALYNGAYFDHHLTQVRWSLDFLKSALGSVNVARKDVGLPVLSP